MGNKVFVQKSPSVWNYSGSLSGSTSSGSFACDGYARVTGIIISSTSSVAGSGLRIKQSSDYGLNYDYVTTCALSACSGSAYSIEIVGNSVEIEFIPDGSVDVFRTNWQARPI